MSGRDASKFDYQHDEKISEFCRVTDADPNEARMFLEGAGWNYDLAVSSFFDDTEQGSCIIDDAMEEQSPEIPVLQPPPSSSSSTTTTSYPTSSRIVTMSSLMENENKSDDEGQAFYAGGSTRSGQQVLGPGNHKGRHIVDEMFKAAKSVGAEVVEPTESQCSSTQLKAFCGTGHVLDSSAAPDSDVRVCDETLGTNRCLTMRLRAWRNGFTVDDGPLREYTDPKNKAFLDSVRKGEIPEELLPKTSRGEISLRLEDRSHEDYVPPKPSSSRAAFSGQGHRLGSPTPKVTSLKSSSDDLRKNEEEAQRKLNVDSSQPTTVVQIRLADGSRLIIKLNLNHTVGNIRQYLVVARPEYSATVFLLMTSFPPAELTDDSATVSEANLLNSVIVQKLL